ncbi:MAG: GMC family oxidoreductase [Chloroflexota bacterium]|nr:GMC family oxidoreductase [Chloroflexota bacterium]
MFVDANQVAQGDSVETDLCIIGAGAAGITIARALGSEPIRITLLESGGLDFEIETQAFNAGESVGLPYFPLDAARLRYFGGTTNHWGGTCRPLDDLDFTRRDGVPNTGWPIGRSDLEPYRESAAHICGLALDEWDVTAWLDKSPHEALPFEKRVVTRVAQIVEPSLRSFGRTYREVVKSLPSVTTYLNANVVDIVLDDSGTRAERVQVATLEGKRFSVTARCFVLAAGGIENPRLLLASRSQRPAGTGNGHDLVGRFFLEHPRFDGGVIRPLAESFHGGFYQPHLVGESRILGYLGLDRALLEQEGLVDVQVRLTPEQPAFYERVKDSEDVDALRRLVNRIRKGSAKGDLADDLESLADDLTSWRRFMAPGTPLPAPRPELLEYIANARPDEVEELLPEFFGDVAVFAYGKTTNGIPADAMQLSTRIDPVPNPDSRVTLSNERDALGMPRVQLDWRLSALDRSSVARTLEIVGMELGSAGLGRLKLLFDPKGDGWPDDLDGGYHHCGTTRMSDDPTKGVVNRDCRLHDLPNLWIAGSSVFVTAGSGTPTMTVVALALRLADHLKEVLG